MLTQNLIFLGINPKKAVTNAPFVTIFFLLYVFCLAAQNICLKQGYICERALAWVASLIPRSGCTGGGLRGIY